MLIKILIGLGAILCIFGVWCFCCFLMLATCILLVSVKNGELHTVLSHRPTGGVRPSVRLLLPVRDPGWPGEAAQPHTPAVVTGTRSDRSFHGLCRQHSFGSLLIFSVTNQWRMHPNAATSGCIVTGILLTSQAPSTGH